MILRNTWIDASSRLKPIIRTMPPLTPWMKRLLWFVGGYNLLAGIGMTCLYHEGYKLLGMEKPDVNLPVQLVGVLVGLFGVGYWLVAANPVENRNVLMLGFWSKALGSLFGVYYALSGKLPIYFLLVLLFSDIIYLPPFAVILRRLYRLAAEDREA
jgi:small multidrug resistance pump